MGLGALLQLLVEDAVDLVQRLCDEGRLACVIRRDFTTGLVDQNTLESGEWLIFTLFGRQLVRLALLDLDVRDVEVLEQILER